MRIVLFGAWWWEIRRVDDDGQEWTEGVRPVDQWSEAGYRHVPQTPERTYRPCTVYCCESGRLEKTTSVEGQMGELPRLLHAVKTWQYDRCKRWAIEPDGDTALVWSPRNSEHSTRVTRRALEAMVVEYEAREGGAA
jgi:hypothetical protein